jgi:hypothetical protein
MRSEQDAMMLVRADLCDRLDSLKILARRLSPREFTESLESMKRLAAAYGLTPVVRLADALERAVAEEGRGCSHSLYLGRLQDAIGCEPLDEEASEALIASVSVRFGA